MSRPTSVVEPSSLGAFVLALDWLSGTCRLVVLSAIFAVRKCDREVEEKKVDRDAFHKKESLRAQADKVSCSSLYGRGLCAGDVVAVRKDSLKASHQSLMLIFTATCLLA